jgi:VWFA-related protein
MTRIALALTALLFLAGHAGVPHPQVFRSEANAVHVDVLVTEGNRPVTGLTAEDFELRDNGILQTVVSSGIDDVPLALLLTLDTSSSVEGSTLSHLKEGAHAALELLKPQDRAALITFANNVSLEAPWGSSSDSLSAAVTAARAGGTTSLYDASFAGLTLHDDVAGHRSLLVVFSDGEDTASWLPADSVLDKARRTDSVVYAVVVDTNGTGRAGMMSQRIANSAQGKLNHRSGIELSPPRVRSVVASTPFLQELSEITGGDVFRTDRTSELRDAFSRILKEFRTRYLLTYTPSGVDTPGWHSIEVKLKDKKGKVRARRGYSR